MGGVRETEGGRTGEQGGSEPGGSSTAQEDAPPTLRILSQVPLSL